MIINRIRSLLSGPDPEYGQRTTDARVEMDDGAVIVYEDIVVWPENETAMMSWESGLRTSYERVWEFDSLASARAELDEDIIEHISDDLWDRQLSEF